MIEKIHKFQMNNLNIVMDINSGAIHVFDQISYDIVEDVENMSLEKIIAKYPQYKKEDIKESYEEIKSLIDSDLLFTTDEYLKDTNIDIETSVIKALCLCVAHDCNLRCPYCFASQGDFGGQRKLMSYEIGKKSLDFLIEHSGNRKNLEVDFFGGEPLMNFEVVKQLVEYGNKVAKEKGKNFRFTITTNGVLLDDDKIEYINKHMHNVVLSLDGRKEINDKNRPTINGSGSYDIIVPKFQKLIEGRKDKYYYVRGTFTSENMDFSKDVQHFKDLGFALTSMEPVVGEDSNPYALKEEHLEKILKEYEDFAIEYAKSQIAGEDFKFFHFMIDLTQGPCVIKRVRGCGAGGEYLAITPEGDIYPCHQFVGEEEYLLGNINDENFEIPKDIKKMFTSTNVFTKEECKKCWARYYCSGGCHANAIHFNNDIKKPYEMGCKMQRKRIECAIMVEVAKQLANEKLKETALI